MSISKVPSNPISWGIQKFPPWTIEYTVAGAKQLCRWGLQKGLVQPHLTRSILSTSENWGVSKGTEEPPDPAGGQRIDYNFASHKFCPLCQWPDKKPKALPWREEPESSKGACKWEDRLLPGTTTATSGPNSHFKNILVKSREEAGFKRGTLFKAIV